MTHAAQWFMAIGGQQVGPVSEADVVNAIKSGSADPTTLVFTTGMTDWTPLRDVDRFRPHIGAAAPPPLPAGRVAPGRQRAHEIDYRIEGEDLQFVEIELDPGESVVAEAGALMYMTAGIQMETIFGDGSGENQSKGLMGALLGSGQAHPDGREPVHDRVHGPGRPQGEGGLRRALPRAGSWRWTSRSRAASSSARRTRSCARPRASRSGSRSRRRSASASSAARASSCSACRATGSPSSTRAACSPRCSSAPAETLRVDTGCLVALQPSVNYDVQFVGGVKTAFFGGEGLFFATLTGPGHVWLQSLPLSRLADRIAKAIPGIGRGRKGEGSVLDHLGGLGNVIDGD